MQKTVSFTGEESTLALLSNAKEAATLFGPPTVPLDRLVQWQAQWLASGGHSLGKPTHFEETEGAF